MPGDWADAAPPADDASWPLPCPPAGDIPPWAWGVAPIFCESPARRLVRSPVPPVPAPEVPPWVEDLPSWSAIEARVSAELPPASPPDCAEPGAWGEVPPAAEPAAADGPSDPEPSSFVAR